LPCVSPSLSRVPGLHLPRHLPRLRLSPRHRHRRLRRCPRLRRRPRRDVGHPRPPADCRPL
jgi:hypothetical protein